MKLIKIGFIIAMVLPLLSSCTSHSKTSGKDVISVSIGPQKYFTQRLLKDKVEINVMIPPGSSHATYSPTPSQLRKLADSKAYLLMGHLSFEATWEDKLKSANKTMAWFDLSNGINLIHGEHDHHHGHDHVCTGGIDPHTWTSPKEMLIIAKNLKEALLKVVPEHKSLIEDNYIKLIGDIEKLDQRLITLSKNNSGLTFMIFHPAYTYLARAYDFEQMTIEFEGKTPTPGRLKSTIVEAREKGIKNIYIQQEFDRANAEVIAKEINATTTQVNPLSENWLEEMDRFISHLEKS